MTETQQPRLVFVDTETTGLGRPGSPGDCTKHEIWEVGLVIVESSGEHVEQQWMLPVDLGRADPIALEIGRFHERYPVTSLAEWPFRDLLQRAELGKGLTHPYDFGREFSKMTRGAVLIGANVGFDEERLDSLLRTYGSTPEWDYHKIDIEAAILGYLASQGQYVSFPFKSSRLSELIGVDVNKFDRHTALGDAQWAYECYRTIGMMNKPNVEGTTQSQNVDTSTSKATARV